jgi:hypothetical protein
LQTRGAGGAQPPAIRFFGFIDFSVFIVFFEKKEFVYRSQNLYIQNMQLYGFAQSA